MKSLYPHLLFLLSFSLFLPQTALMAQDVLYLQDGSRLECKVLQLNTEQLSYVLPSNPNGNPFTLNRQNLMLAFLSTGQFAVFDSKLSTGFKAFGKVGTPTDKILTYDYKLEEVSILSQTGESIKYHKTSLPDGPSYTRQLINVLLIVYGDGRHEMFEDAFSIAQALLELEGGGRELAIQGAAVATEPVYSSNDYPVDDANNPTPASTEPVADTYQEASSYSQSPATSSSTTASDDFNNAGNSSSDQTGISYEEPSSNEPTEPAYEEPVADDGNLKVDMDEFSQKALDKTQTLGRYFTLIANKQTPYEDANAAIDLAVKLFINEDAGVEVSSANSVDKKMYPIRRYLDRLKLLKYDRIDIKWSDINYVSNLRKAPDGNYYGVISFVQKFTGYRDGVAVYSDYTQKNIEVILKGYVKEVAGESVELWDVFLSDIGVVNTRRG
ncbi:MAG: hypothetical protein AAF399_20580 [Bacteroidota bacterium]